MNAQMYDHHQVDIQNERTAIRINVGGESYTDINGQTWLADKYFIGGKPFSTKTGITATSDSPLYQTERWGKTLRYVVPVNNGNYTVNLGFAEIWANEPGVRIFSIIAENQPIFSNFDIYKEAGEKHIALNKSFSVAVSDGELNLDFLASANNAKLSAIEIIEDTVSATNTIEHRIQGIFAGEGFLANGHFSGWFSYSLDTPDINESVTNVGTFEIIKFQIDVFDANNNVVDTLNESNSNARISLQDIDPLDEQADTYVISTTPKTAGDDFFEHGEFQLTFDWVGGGNPKLVPNQAPQEFKEAYFSSYAAAGGWEGIVNPQQIQVASIEDKAGPVTLGLQGLFTNTGFLANGNFEGWLTYDANAVDVNASITNVGSFDLEDFQISLFDAEGNLISTLNDTNSKGQVSLQDIDPVDDKADTYLISIIPDTEVNGNAFFEFGELNITFDWALGGNPNIAPIFIPQVFKAGNFASYADAGGWEGVINPQQIQAATIGAVTTPVLENGLNATYFSDRNLQNPVLSRVDTTVDFLWGDSSPDPILPRDNFSVRWSGYIAPEYSETYELSTSSDDGVRLWVGDDLLIDNWTRHAQTIDRGYIDLEVGEMYPITLEYFESMGQAVSQLSWSSNSQELEIIPQNHLFVSNGLDALTVVV